MFGKTIPGWAMALLLVPIAAPAEPPFVDIEKRLTPEQRHATGLDTLSAEQLELLNRLLRDGSTKAAQSERRHADDEPDHGMYVGLDDQPISSRLKGSIGGWEPGTVFVLENGQSWKVLKGSVKLRHALQAPVVVVIPGIAGRWFLQVVEDMPKARVYRID